MVISESVTETAPVWSRDVKLTNITHNGSREEYDTNQSLVPVQLYHHPAGS